MRIVFTNIRLVDKETDVSGSLIVDNGIITGLEPRDAPRRDTPREKKLRENAALVIDGKSLAPKGKGLPVLMPAFVDLHAHFRDPGVQDKETTFPAETIESGCLAAAAGGFGTIITMANTKPVVDTPEKVQRLRERGASLGLIDLFPVMSLTRGMDGTELSFLAGLKMERGPGQKGPLFLSEDGKDIAQDSLFLAAMAEARRLGIPVSCHCDFGGPEAEALKSAGLSRNVWSRVEENNAVARVIRLGKKAGCHIHIAHVSTKEAAGLIRAAKAGQDSAAHGFRLTAEAMPHNICLTEEDAARMGPKGFHKPSGSEESFGRVNPPLRNNEDREALIKALKDGTIDAIATDHAPHTMDDKAKGVPGFSGLETAFAACNTELVQGVSVRGGRASGQAFTLKELSALMSANPAGLAGLFDRGRLSPGMKADLVIVSPETQTTIEPELLKTRGKNSPFAGQRLFGTILMTLHNGSIVFHS